MTTKNKIGIWMLLSMIGVLVLGGIVSMITQVGWVLGLSFLGLILWVVVGTYLLAGK